MFEGNLFHSVRPVKDTATEQVNDEKGVLDFGL